jgi:hypothetical protein
MKVSSPAPAGAPVRHELVNQSVFLGNISGAPRAMAGLLTFFLKSTFIGAVAVRPQPDAPAGAYDLRLRDGQTRALES